MVETESTPVSTTLHKPGPLTVGPGRTTIRNIDEMIIPIASDGKNPLLEPLYTAIVVITSSITNNSNCHIYICIFCIYTFS